jgi:hypothetical protein
VAVPVTKNRRAHFPVGGKRNTLNFFGHGNRPKKKGKTAAEDEEEDERPRTRRRHSKSSEQEWLVLAAVGALGAGATYWAFQNPRKVEAAARSLGVADLAPVRTALNFISGGTPEDRAVKERDLAAAAEAAHGSAAKVPQAMDPSTRTAPRALNAQEAKVVQGLRTAGNADQADLLEHHLAGLPDSGPLTIPKASGDPGELAAQLLQARSRYDEFRLQAEHGAMQKAIRAGATSDAEINQQRAKAAGTAKAQYESFVAHPATLSDSVGGVTARRAEQGFGSEEIRQAQLEHAGIQLQEGTPRDLSGRRTALRDDLLRTAEQQHYDQQDPRFQDALASADVGDVLTTARLHPGSPWAQQFGALAAEIQPTPADQTAATSQLARLDQQRRARGEMPLSPEQRTSALQELTLAPATARFATERFKQNPEEVRGLLKRIDTMTTEAVITKLLDPKTAAGAPLLADAHDVLTEALKGVPREQWGQVLQRTPELAQFVEHAHGTHAALVRQGSDASASSGRNVEAVQDLAGRSRPASSIAAGIPDYADAAVTAATGGAGFGWADMLLRSAGYRHESRGGIHPLSGDPSEVIRAPVAAQHANRTRAILDRVRAESAAEAKGDAAELRRIRSVPLPTGAESREDIEASNAAAERGEGVARVAQNLGFNSAMRVSAPNMAPGAAAVIGGGLGLLSQGYTALRDGTELTSPEFLRNTAQTAGGAATFAAQVAAARSRPDIARQIAKQHALEEAAPKGVIGRLGDTLRGITTESGPGKAFQRLLSSADRGAEGVLAKTMPNLSRAVRGVTNAVGILGESPEGLQGIRALSNAGVADRLAARPTAGMLERFGIRSMGAAQSGAQQLKWVGSLSTKAEAAAALGRLSTAAVRSPLLVAAMQVNALRGVASFGVTTAQFGVIGTGVQAGVDLGGHAINALRGEARDANYLQQYRDALNGTLKVRGDLQGHWGTGGYGANVRDAGSVIWNTVTLDWQGIKERQAATLGESRMLFEGANPSAFSEIGAKLTGARDYWENSATVRGVRDARLAIAEEDLQLRATSVAQKLIDGNPLYANASVRDRDGIVATVSRQIAGNWAAGLQGRTVIKQSDVTDLTDRFDRHIKAFKPDPMAAVDPSGASFLSEYDRFLKHVLPDDTAGANAGLREAVADYGKHNAIANQGGDLDKAIYTGDLDRQTEVLAGYADRHIDAFNRLPGGVGTLYSGVHDKVYGPLKRAVDHALKAPELRSMSPERKTAIRDAALQRARTQLEPAMKGWLAANPKADPSEFTKEPLAGFLKQNPWIQEPERTTAISGSAEHINEAGLKELAPLLPPELATTLLDPKAITAEADALTGTTFEQRNNQPEVGLYTAASPEGQAAKQRDAAWVQDLEAAGIKLPDQAGFERTLSAAVRSGAEIPKRYVDVDRAQRTPEAARRGAVEFEMGPQGTPRLVIRGSPDTKRPTYDQGTMVTALRALGQRNPELIQQLGAQQGTPVGVLLAQERPWLQEAMKAPDGAGFVKLGPQGTPVGTVSSWEELRADILNPANTANYASAWRPEVQKYLQDHQTYQAARAVPRPVESQEQRHPWPAYQEVMKQEQQAFHAKNPGEATWKPSVEYVEFAQKFKKDPYQFKGVLPAAEEVQHVAATEWDRRQAELRAPAGPGPVPRYAPPPKPMLSFTPPAVTPPTAAVSPPQPLPGQLPKS